MQNRSVPKLTTHLKCAFSRRRILPVKLSTKAESPDLIMAKAFYFVNNIIFDFFRFIPVSTNYQ
jgi:hypothetical protein